jgi:hypothetical protein
MSVGLSLGELKTTGMLNIPCDYDHFYTGQTGNSNDTGVRENWHICISLHLYTVAMENKHQPGPLLAT